MAEALTLPDAPDWLYEKEFPLEDPNRVDKKDYFFGR